MRDFFLRTTKTEGQASLYVYARRRTPSISFTINTKIVVDIVKWYKAKESVKEWDRWITVESTTYQRMKEIDEAISNLLSLEVADKKYYDEAVDNIVFREIREAERVRQEAKEKAELQAIQQREAEERERKLNPVFFLAEFIEGIKNGTILNGSEHYSANTCKVWVSFLGIFKRFYDEHPFRLNELSEDVVNKFILFLEQGEYMVKSQNKYIICFRAIAQRAVDKNVINAELMTAFKKKKKRVLDNHKATEIYLTADEVQALYEMKLAGKRAEVRDSFLVGVYTCQRYSDYSEIRAENFSTTAKGNKVIRLIQQKTKNQIVIPVLNDNLLNIAKKYDYNLPKVSDVILNRYIKLILKDLSESVPSLAKMLPTILTQKEVAKEERGEITFRRDAEGRVIKPRYDLISTHSARRTGITNLYLTGNYDTFQMMAVSGHKDAKTFTEYIKLSSDEIADIILQRQQEAANNEIF